MFCLFWVAGEGQRSYSWGRWPKLVEAQDQQPAALAALARIGQSTLDAGAWEIGEVGEDGGCVRRWQLQAAGWVEV